MAPGAVGRDNPALGRDAPEVDTPVRDEPYRGFSIDR